MKIRAIHLLPMLALTASPLFAQAPAAPAPPPVHHPAPPTQPAVQAAPHMERAHVPQGERPHAEHARVPQGERPKVDDARDLAMRLRQLAQNHPEVARRILREAQAGQPQQAKPAEQPQKPVRENVANVAKARHLREAAKHLAAAGFPDQAAKAREGAERIAGQSKPPGMVPQRDRIPAPGVAGHPNPWQRDMPQAKGQAPTVQPLHQELRKINQQLEQLSRRVNRLEEAGPK